MGVGGGAVYVVLHPRLSSLNCFSEVLCAGAWASYEAVKTSSEVDDFSSLLRLQT